MVSVVIPTYNEGKVFKAISEVKKQEPEEIIVVDDFESSKDYKKRLRGLEGIKYVEAERGLAGARNKGIGISKEEKIIFLDADAYPRPSWLEKMSKALDEADIVQAKVNYKGERCPLNKIVENQGDREKRLLGACFGAKKKVFKEVKFDPDNFPMFREETNFLFRALEKGFEYQFVEEAIVFHDTGRYDLKSFIGDRKRYVDEPLFYKKFKDHPLFEKEVSHLGPFLYPLELIMVLGLLLSIPLVFLNVPLALGWTLFICTALSVLYTYKKHTNKNAKICPKDLLKGVYYVPLGLITKRIAIWKGVIRNKIFVI